MSPTAKISFGTNCVQVENDKFKKTAVKISDILIKIIIFYSLIISHFDKHFGNYIREAYRNRWGADWG